MKAKLIVAGLIIFPFLSAAADAAQRRYTEVPNRDACWSVEYVPRTVEVNTRGRLIQGERRVWNDRDLRDGGVVISERHPALYEKTRRIVEEEHYSLDPTPCVPRKR